MTPSKLNPSKQQRSRRPPQNQPIQIKPSQTVAAPQRTRAPHPAYFLALGFAFAAGATGAFIESLSCLAGVNANFFDAAI